MRLPLGVVIPTLNSRQFLSRSLPELHTLLALAEEVVVVDGFSEDGTLDLLRSALKQTRCRFFSRPRGLYQAWNFGVSQLRTRYATITTAGETLTGAGASRLIAVAEQFKADVVISPPEFVTPAGAPVPAKRWPVHQFISAHGLREPGEILPVHVFLLALLDVPDGIMGSSASNLYRTATLQRLPFRTDYDHLGDTAWGVENAFRARFAVVPACFSRFVIHDSGARLTEEKKSVLIQRFFELGERALREAMSAKPPLAEGADLLGSIGRLGPEIRALRENQAEYSRLHRQFPPWICNLQAWRARTRRNTCRSAVNRTKAELRRRFRLCVEPPVERPGRGMAATAAQ